MTFFEINLSCKAPLLISNLDSKFDFDVLVSGGGIMGQVYAIRLALARVLFNLVDEASIDNLKSYGFFNRDSRIKERRSKILKWKQNYNILFLFIICCLIFIYYIICFH